MYANQLADALEPLVFNAHYEARGVRQSAAAMLRRQHEAIVKLRKALMSTRKALTSRLDDEFVAQALKDTEDLK